MIQYVLLFADIVIVILGALATSICFKGYKQNNSFSMFCLTMGFLLIAAGPVVAAVLLGFSGLGFWEIQTIESVIIAFGFVYIVHSIFTKRR